MNNLNAPELGSPGWIGAGKASRGGADRKIATRQHSNKLAPREANPREPIERVFGGRPLPPRLAGAVIALGNFDGFHLGHQAVATRAMALARARGVPVIVATFDPHPKRLFKPDATPFRLTSLDQRQRLFGDYGVDAMMVFEFTRALAEHGISGLIPWLLFVLFAALKSLRSSSAETRSLRSALLFLGLGSMMYNGLKLASQPFFVFLALAAFPNPADEAQPDQASLAYARRAPEIVQLPSNL